MSSSAGENGTGACGAVTIFTGAFSEPNISSATSAAMSVAIEHRGCELVHHDHAAGLPRGLQHGFAIERRGRAKVDYRRLHAALGEIVGGLVGEIDHPTHRDDRNVTPFAGHVGLAERNRIGLVGHFSLDVVHRLVFEHDDRIVVPDRLDHQALRLVRVGRQHDLEARDVGEEGIEALRVLRRRAETGAVHGADDHRGHRLAAEHVAELGGLIEDLVETDAHEIDEHQVGDRPQPGRGGADRSADEGQFGDWRVEHPLASELRHQALGDAERAAPRVLLAGRAGAAGDVLAHHDHARIALHFLTDRLVDGLTIALFRHLRPLSSGCRRRSSAWPPAASEPPSRAPPRARWTP